LTKRSIPYSRPFSRTAVHSLPFCAANAGQNARLVCNQREC
jgi:hypothetical protein